jgi:hypothetical protein
MIFENPREDTRANAFLCNLGAALRIASWERSGLKPALPVDLPSSFEAFRNVMPPEMSGTTVDVPFASEPYQKVFRTWCSSFPEAARFRSEPMYTCLSIPYQKTNSWMPSQICCGKTDIFA